MREQTWQKCQVVGDFANPIARAKSRARKARAPGDLLFLSFAKSKCQFPWRWPVFIFCILLEHLQQLCNWNLAFVGICQVPKPFAKGKISSSSSVWYFWLDISQNSGPNYFCPGIFHLRGKFSRASCGLPSRASPSPVAANSLARRSRLAENYRDVGSTGTTRSPRFSGYQNCQAIVPMQKCQVWQNT